MHSLLLLQDFAVVLLVAGISGLVFRRIGLSVVIGYLAAGVLIGPYTPPFTLVSDLDRIQTLSQLGLVFLMFFVGLGLSLSRIRRLGFVMLASTILTAWLVFNFSQIFAHFAGWSHTTGLFFSAMLMVSSSAIISKILSEQKITHEKFAQRAQGAMVLEDIVAVVMLTLLASGTPAGGHGPAAIAKTLGLLGGFVVLMMVLGLLFLPGLLKRFSKSQDGDLKMLLVAGLLFVSAVTAAKAGFSPALGAFLLGMVIAETPFKHKVEKLLSGTQDMFSAIFFVSIGMLIDVHAAFAQFPLILGAACFAIAARFFAALLAYLISGNNFRGSIRTALCIIPIGEFSYVIAQTGISDGTLSADFNVLAVGISILTAAAAPLLTRFSGPIADLACRHQPNVLQRILAAYETWLQALAHRQDQYLWWRLTKGRLGQVAVELLLIAGVLSYSSFLHSELNHAIGLSGFAFPGWSYLYWFLIGLINLILIIAVWRNMGALSLIYAEAGASQAAQPGRLKPVIEGGFQLAAAVGLLWLIGFFMPPEAKGPWTVVIIIVLCLLFGAVFWRRLIRWHSQLQYSLNQRLLLSSRAGLQGLNRSFQGGRAQVWKVELVEFVVPDQALYRGKTLADLPLRRKFGCNVVEIERQGVAIPNPRPDFALFPSDRLLLFGSESQIQAALDYLQQEGGGDAISESFDETRLETVAVPPESPRAGQTLQDLRISVETGVQVLGIKRGEKILLNPGGDETLKPGDLLLILATAQATLFFTRWLDG
ncbi:MAG: cation:proton antiporter [Methylacidiphilales bacterium]|nr:cation:proton antiporter [Candidatus Methylacidiphilales bacterium]